MHNRLNKALKIDAKGEKKAREERQKEAQKH